MNQILDCQPQMKDLQNKCVFVGSKWGCVRRGNIDAWQKYLSPLEKKNISQEYPKIVVALQDMLGEWITSLPVKPTGKVFSKLRGQ